MQRSENNIGETNLTSVKVHHAPGGSSNLNLGWDDSSNARPTNKKQQAPHLQSNIAFGDYQEQPRNMRSEGNIGESNQTSVKVHAAPGGNSNFNLSHGDEPMPTRSMNQQAFATQGNSKPQYSYNQQQQQGQVESQEGNPNFKPSVKVHNPPGGRSNFTLG